MVTPRLLKSFQRDLISFQDVLPHPSPPPKFAHPDLIFIFSAFSFLVENRNEGCGSWLGSQDPKKTHVYGTRNSRKVVYQYQKSILRSRAEVCNSVENISCERVTIQIYVINNVIKVIWQGCKSDCHLSVGDLLGSWVHSHGQHLTVGSFTIISGLK